MAERQAASHRGPPGDGAGTSTGEATAHIESRHVCPRCESELVYPIDAALDADQILPEDF